MSKSQSNKKSTHKRSSKSSTRATGKTSQSQPKTANRTWLWIGLGAVVVLLLGVIAFFPGLQSQTGETAGASEAQAVLTDEISVQEAVARRDAGAFILDVRTPEEWDDHHIPGSTLITLDELENRLSEVPQDQEVVVVCRSGNRSATGRDILREAGFENVTSMAGGLNAWRDAGYPTVSGP